MDVKNGTSVTAFWFAGLGRRTKMAVAGFILFTVLAAGLFIFYEDNGTELRSSVPADTLAFVAVKDLGKVYRAGASPGPSDPSVDFSFLDGVEVAVAVTGLQATEEELTGATSILSLRPTFAAVAETNAWSWQVDGLIDGPLNRFFESVYGKGTKKTLEEGKYGDLIVWSAPDGRASFAAVEGTLVFLGNDKPSLERCLAAHRGESKSLVEDAGLADPYGQNPDAIAIGYFPRRAIEAFAEAAGVSAAVRGSDDGASRLFISRLVPQLFQNIVESAVWVSQLDEGEFTDEIQIKTNDRVSRIFSETMKESESRLGESVRFLPVGTTSVTRYNLKNPRLGFRSLILVAADNTDALSGRLVSVYSDAILETYGIARPEQFLASVEPLIVSFEVGDSERSAAVVRLKDRDAALAALLPEFKSATAGTIEGGAELWDAQGMTVAITGSSMIIGEKTAVEAALAQRGSAPQITKSDQFQSFRDSRATAVSVTIDVDGADGARPSNESSFYLTETNFEANGIIRRYRSRTGLIESFLPGTGE